MPGQPDAERDLLAGQVQPVHGVGRIERGQARAGRIVDGLQDRRHHRRKPTGFRPKPAADLYLFEVNEDRRDLVLTISEKFHVRSCQIENRIAELQD